MMIGPEPMMRRVWMLVSFGIGIKYGFKKNAGERFSERYPAYPTRLK
jgi:hypothetical protein